MKKNKLLILSITLICISCILTFVASLFLYKTYLNSKTTPHITIKKELPQNQQTKNTVTLQKISLNDEDRGEIILDKKIEENILTDFDSKSIDAKINYEDFTKENNFNCQIYFVKHEIYTKCSNDEWYSVGVESLLPNLSAGELTQSFSNYELYFTLQKNVYNSILKYYNNSWKENKTNNVNIYINEDSSEIIRILGISSYEKLFNSPKQKIDSNSIQTELKVAIKNETIMSIEHSLIYQFTEKDHNHNTQKYELKYKKITEYKNVNDTELSIPEKEIEANIDPIYRLKMAGKKQKSIDSLQIDIDLNETSTTKSTYGGYTYNSTRTKTVSESHSVNIKGKLAIVNHDSKTSYSNWDGTADKYTLYRYENSCYNEDKEKVIECDYFLTHANFYLSYDWSYFSNVLELINEPSKIDSRNVKFIEIRNSDDKEFYLYEINTSHLNYLVNSGWKTAKEGKATIWLNSENSFIEKIEIETSWKDTDSGTYSDVYYVDSTTTTETITYTIKSINSTNVQFPKKIKEHIKKTN